MTRPLEPFISASLVLRAGAMQEGEVDQGLAALTLAAVMEGGERLGVRDLARERPLRDAEAAMLAALPTVRDVRGREALLRAAGAAELAAAGAALRDEYYAGALGLGGREPVSLSGPGSIVSVEIPTHRFGAWVELSAEMLRRPIFRNFLTVTAQKLEFLAWIAEGRGAEQAATRALSGVTGIHEDFAAAATKLALVPLGDARRFWATYYRPNNTAVVLIGDITPTEALPILERAFGDWEPAAIPKPAHVDRPLAQARTQIDVHDTGAPLALLVWALPPPSSPDFPAFLELNRVLAGPDGILAGALRDSTSGGTCDVGPLRDFQVGVYPGPGQSLAEAEAQVYGVLEDVAADRIPEAIWERALAQAELERHRWARTNGALTRLVVESYLGRSPWQDVAQSLGPTPVDRARIVRAATALLGTGHVAVHRTPGKPPVFPGVRLPIERVPPQLGVHSDFVRALIDAPSIPMEPRFLVEGSHYRVHERGAGRVVATQTRDPIVRLGWIHRVGAAEDPFVCDAVRALADRIPVAGFEASVTCSTGETRIDLVATAAAFERELPAVLAWLTEGELEPDAAELHAEQSVQWRREVRSDPWNRAAALHAWALRGPAMLDVMLPDDETMRTEGPRAMVASLQALAQRDPDIVYVGPAPQLLLDALPPPHGQAGATPPPRAWR
ncbi:MAG: insulinase family protein, partial [Myxococcales bacterium]|nr:insulinase family protein [Myxococcales bacterium]